MAQEPTRSRALGLIPEAVLAHVPGFTVGGTTWATRLPGGTVNASYLVETSAGRFVARIHHEVAAALGADHEREARLHAAAAAVGLAPALIHVDPAYGFMIMEHVAGPTWAAEDFDRPDRLRQLGAAFHVLHSVAPPSVAPFDIGASIARLSGTLCAALPGEAAGLAQLVDRAGAALRIADSAQRPKAVIHNDLHHTNLIGTARLYLVDWEYAAVTDPLIDLACLLAYYPGAGAHVETLLDSSRLAGQASPEMLAAMTWLCVLVSYLWYRVRRLSGPVPAHEMAAEQGLLARLS
jgi:aminoglycoside phosphotransferase (APT) family kinase protein